METKAHQWSKPSRASSSRVEHSADVLKLGADDDALDEEPSSAISEIETGAVMTVQSLVRAD